MSFVTHLECSKTGKRHEAGKPQNLSEAGKPLFVRYDLEALKGAITKEELATRHYGLWRYHEFLPVTKPENMVSLGEVISPIIRIPNLLKKLGVKGELIIKDESRQPTSSFKARGLGLAVSMAKEFGIKHAKKKSAGSTSRP